MRVQQSLERQLEEGQARWDQERRTLSHHADKAHKVLLSPSLVQVPPIAVFSGPCLIVCVKSGGGAFNQPSSQYVFFLSFFSTLLDGIVHVIAGYSIALMCARSAT